MNILARQKIKATNTSSYSFNKATKTFARKYQAIGTAKSEFNKLKNQDKAVFNGAMYTSIYRFESPVTNVTNPASNLSKTKKAVMLKSSITKLINGKINVSNQIQLSKQNEKTPFCARFAVLWHSKLCSGFGKENSFKRLYRCHN